MKQPLVAPLDRNASPESKAMASFYDETLGFTPNSLFTMMHRPKIAKAFLTLNQAVMDNQGRLTAALKRQIAYLSSQTTGCRYCEAHAIRAAARYGSEEDKMKNLWNYKTYPAFTAGERAAFDFAIAASQIPNGVNDTIAAALRAHWDEGEIVEITGVVALFGYLNRWNDSMGTALEAPAAKDASDLLEDAGWNMGKHQYDKA